MKNINEYKTVITHEHLDMMGHVNNATYIQLMENARWSFYEAHHFTRELALQEQYGPIILEANIKYRKELFLGEEIKIVTNCLEYSGVLGTLEQIVYNDAGKRSCCAHFVFGLFDLKNRKLILPRGLWKELHQNIAVIPTRNL